MKARVPWKAACAVAAVLVAASCGSSKKSTGDAEDDTAPPDGQDTSGEPDGPLPDVVDVPPDVPDGVDVPDSTTGCGDGNVDYAAGEECDDGNTLDGDGCSSTCRRESPPHCGDANLDIDEGEQCDDGNTTPGDGCSPTCQFETVGGSCGDSTTDAGEVCDDGNTANGDSCNPTCNLTNTTEVLVGSPGSQGRAEGTGTSALIGGYGTITVDAQYLYYADGNNHVVSRVDVATRQLVIIAGDAAGGTASYLDNAVGLSARFQGIEAITTDGNTVWVSDSRRIRAIDLATPNAVTTVAGSGVQAHTDGFGTAAEFDDLRGLTYFDGFVYLLDATSATLRRFDPSTTEVVTLAGSPYATGTVDGFGTAARFVSPRYMASDNSGMLYIADTNGNAIRAYNTVTTEVTTFAGSGTAGYVDGIGTAALVHRPRGMTSDGTSLYWVEFNQHTVRQGVFATAQVSTLVGTHCGGTMPCAGGYNEGTGTAALFDSPFSIAFHYPSGSLYVVDGGNYVIRRIH